MTLTYTSKCCTCAPASSGSSADSCPAHVLSVGDSGPSMEVNVFKDGVGRPADLEGYTAEASIYYNTRLYYPIDVTDTAVRLYPGEGDTWPVIGDELIISELYPESMFVNSIISNAGDFGVTRGTNLVAHFEDVDVKVLRAVTPVEIKAVREIDDFNGSEWLTRTYLRLDFNSQITGGPGLFMVKFKLLSPNGLTTTIPNNSDGYKLQFIAP